MAGELINVIIPYGHNDLQPEREELLHHVVEECVSKQTYRNTRIILIESSSRRTQEDFARENCDSYLYFPLQGPFNVGRVQNYGYTHTPPTRLMYIHQADFLLPVDALEQAVATMEETNAPFIYPFYSAVNLSKPFTEAIVSGIANWTQVYSSLRGINGQFRNTSELTAQRNHRNRVALTPDQLRLIEQFLPEDLHSLQLRKLSDEQLWGVAEEAFTYFKGSEIDSRCNVLVNYRVGPRAKASYLAKTEAYAEVGGAPEFSGWAYEDLILWEKVKAFYGYSLHDDAIWYQNFKLTTDNPLVHLWHSTTGQTEYIAGGEDNKQVYERFIAMSTVEKIASVTRLRRLGQE